MQHLLHIYENACLISSVAVYNFSLLILFLSKTVFNEVRDEFSKRLHTTEDVNWHTFPKFEKELVDLQIYLNEKVKIFMGDTPINLDSPEDRSILFYSMRIKFN